MEGQWGWSIGREGHTVDEEFSGLLRRDFAFLSFLLFPSFLQLRTHGVLQQLHRHFHGHYFAVGDILLDQAPELAVWPVLLSAEEVSG